MQRYLGARRQHNGGGVEGNLLNGGTVVVLQQTLTTAFPDNNDIIGTTCVGTERISSRNPFVVVEQSGSLPEAKRVPFPLYVTQ